MPNRALLVGVSRYEDKSLRPLKAPLEDVVRLERQLRENGDFEVEPLLDRGKDEFQTKARAFLRGSRPNDRIVFYYSGHGLRDFKGQLYLTTGGVNPQDPWIGGVSASEIRSWAREGNASQLVLILDCCFAAASGEGRGADAGAVVTRDDLMPQKEGRGSHILMASDRDQIALTGEELPPDGRASHFTDLIIRGLEGDAAPGMHEVTIARLSEFLQIEGERLGTAPVIEVEHGRGDFRLVRVPEPDLSLVRREVRGALESPRKVERVGAATLLGHRLASSVNAREAAVARRLLEQLREREGDYEVRGAVADALAAVSSASVRALQERIGAAEREREGALAELREAKERERELSGQAQAALSTIEDAEARLRSAVSERDRLRLEVRELHHDVAERDQFGSQLESRLDVARRQHRDALERAADAERRLEEMTAWPDELARLRHERDASRREAEKAAQDAAAAASELGSLRARLDANVAATAVREAELIESRQSREDEARRADEAVRQVQAVRDALAGSEQHLAQAEADAKDARATAAGLTAELATARQESESLQRHRDRQDGLIATLREAHGDLERRLGMAADLAAKRMASFDERTREVEALGSELARRQKRIAELESATGGGPGGRRMSRIAASLLVLAGGVTAASAAGWWNAEEQRRALARQLQPPPGGGTQQGRPAVIVATAPATPPPTTGVAPTQAAPPVVQPVPAASPAPAPPAALPAAPPIAPSAASPASPAVPVAPPPRETFDCPTCPRLVRVEGVGVLVGRSAVTVAEFRAFAQANGFTPGGGCRTPGRNFADSDLSWESPGFQQGPDHPVVCVSRQDADRYVSWLSSQTGKRYRLVNTAERFAIITRRYPATSVPPLDQRCRLGNVRDASLRQSLEAGNFPRAAPGLSMDSPNWATCSDSHPFTSPVGRGESLDGVGDLFGNVLEWANEPPAQGQATVAGSSWGSIPEPPGTTAGWTTWAGSYGVAVRSNFIGFRVAREP